MAEIRTALVAFGICLFCSTFAMAENTALWNGQSEPAPIPGHTVILPSPQPFSLSAYDAIQAMAMMRRIHLLEYRGDDGKIEIIAVHQLWAVLMGVDMKMYAGHRRRYNLILNGKPVDWNHLYIAYGAGLVNLRLLFTYRNQYPPKNLIYRLP